MLEIKLTPKRQAIPSKIRNPNIEIRNKTKHLIPNYQSPNPHGPRLEVGTFDHSSLFRFSDFVLRGFALRVIPSWAEKNKHFRRFVDEKKEPSVSTTLGSFALLT